MGERRDGERYRATRTPHYRSWLLRSWAGQSSGDAAGRDRRYYLEDPNTGARCGFASLDDLVTYLQAESAANAAARDFTG